MGWSGFLWKACTVILAFVAPLPIVKAHGYLAEPASRNLLAHRAGQEWDPQSLAGGGPASVWPDGYWVFGGGGNHPICGRDQYEKPGPIQATWRTGQIVKLKVTFTAVHRGHIYFGLCPANIKPTPECFAKHWLTSIDTVKRYWDLGDRPIGTYDMQLTREMVKRLQEDADAKVSCLY
jgi:hypothetical protein